MCHRILCKEGLVSTFKYGTENVISIDKSLECLILTQYLNIDSNANYFSLNWLIFRGVRYEVGNVIMKINDILPKLYQIKFIIVFQNEITFICSPLRIVQWDKHFNSYEVDLNTNNQMICERLIKLYIPENLHLISNNKYYVRMQQFSF